MAKLLRLLAGLALLPFCWGVMRAFFDVIVDVAGASGGYGVETAALLAGVAAFLLCWLTLSHPVKTYVLGHELTHALWGLVFGARPSRVRVGRSGGSVRLTKTNIVIALAPYFFPFYTFLVLLAARVTLFFVRPLPCPPIWMFAVGFTWAFHVLFTFSALAETQPDITPYGRVFSWVIIFLVNLLLVLVVLAAVTPLSFPSLSAAVFGRVAAAYSGVAAFCRWL